MSKPLHPSFGAVPPAEFYRAMQAPAGHATEILRQFVPTFGIRGSDPTAMLKKFEVSVSRTCELRQHARISVEAQTKDEAEKLIDAMDWDGFAWSDGQADTDDHEIDHIMETK